MTKSTPFALLVSAASDPAVLASRLVRSAQVVAGAADDSAMGTWCARELEGYGTLPTDAVPDYRKVAARLMVTDAWGRQIPALIRNPEHAKRLMDCPLPFPLPELDRMAGADSSAAFQFFFPPEFAQTLKHAFDGAVDVFRVVQRSAVEGAVSAVRQRVFAWAVPRLHDQLDMPTGLTVESMLGIAIEAEPRHVGGPMEARLGAGVTISGLQNSSVVVHSPGAVASVARDQTATDMEALRGLVTALAEGIESAKSKGAAADALAPIEESASELKGLLELKSPRREWVKQAAESLRGVLEQTAGAVAGALATPYVQALIAQLSKG